MANKSDLPILTSLIAGGIAGLTVDVALFPLDTLKTRLQSPSGFLASGGFNNVYKGVGITAVGSVPSAAVFFCTYNTINRALYTEFEAVYFPMIHMAAAAAGEIGSCLVKVPVEVVKQRQQAAIIKLSTLYICRQAIKAEGYLGMYRGFTTTVLREVPFVLIEFPIWEWLKTQWFLAKEKDLNAIEVAICGSLAGAVAGAVTTPLDVAKTRIMLAEKNIVSIANVTKFNTTSMLIDIYKHHGIQGLFAGFIPRTLWITLGGAVFFGAYQAAVDLCSDFNVLDTINPIDT